MQIGMQNFHDAQVACSECWVTSGGYDVDDGDDNQEERNKCQAAEAWNRRVTDKLTDCDLK